MIPPVNVEHGQRTIRSFLGDRYVIRRHGTNLTIADGSGRPLASVDAAAGTWYETWLYLSGERPSPRRIRGARRLAERLLEDYVPVARRQRGLVARMRRATRRRREERAT